MLDSLTRTTRPRHNNSSAKSSSGRRSIRLLRRQSISQRRNRNLANRPHLRCNIKRNRTPLPLRILRLNSMQRPLRILRPSNTLSRSTIRMTDMTAGNREQIPQNDEGRSVLGASFLGSEWRSSKALFYLRSSLY